VSGFPRTWQACFEVGKVYKVKVETVPGQPGFAGRDLGAPKATRLKIHVRTIKSRTQPWRRVRESGSSPTPRKHFNGLWHRVSSYRTQDGRPILNAARQNLEPLYQRAALLEFPRRSS